MYYKGGVIGERSSLNLNTHDTSTSNKHNNSNGDNDNHVLIQRNKAIKRNQFSDSYLDFPTHFSCGYKSDIKIYNEYY